MFNQKSLIQRDLNHIWHPHSIMRTFEQYPPIVIYSAKGNYLHTDRGWIIDAISSWWCKSLGHGHPAVIAAIQEQLMRFEHVISANTTHPSIVELAEELQLLSGKQHVFFASDGSSAVEIALKLALQATQLSTPNIVRDEIITLSNGYHGETLGALSVSDLDKFKQSFTTCGFKSNYIQDLPYVLNQQDPLWHDCSAVWESIYNQLELFKPKACAILVEPIIQGAGGMRCYSADFLYKLSNWAKENRIYFIADEIMTGIGRTGKTLALEHANANADIICLSKGLTSGSIPLSCVLIDHSIYDLFYQQTDLSKAFLHSHTFTGHALGVSAALAVLKVMKAENIPEQAALLGVQMTNYFQDIANVTGILSNLRSIGAIVAADFNVPNAVEFAQQVAGEALNRGALLRPLGKTLYWLPPLNMDQNTLAKLAEITLKSIKAVQKCN